jgi:zinc transport system permease protein
MFEILEFDFMRNALAAAFLVSIACGIVGTYVVVKKIVFISGGISHTAFGGIGLGYLLGVNPILTAIPFSILAALGMGSAVKNARISEDSAIGILWSVGMALGILFVFLAPGYAPDLFSYLFGNILTVPFADLALMAALDLVIICTVFAFYKEFLAISFDDEFAEVSSLPSKKLYLLLLCLVALSIIVMMRVVGIILVIALLTIPATIGRLFSNNLRRIMFYSVLVGTLTSAGGLAFSYFFDVPSGATIILLLAALFGVVHCASRHKAFKGV